jgi:membrane protease YdiL (CAAX protease family)
MINIKGEFLTALVFIKEILMNQDYTYYQDYQNETEPVILPQKPPRARLHIGTIAFAITLGMLVTLIVQMIGAGVISALNPALIENDWFSMAFSVVPIYLIEMPIDYLLLLTIPKSVPQKKKHHPLMWFGFAFLCFFVSYLSSFVGQFVDAWIYNFFGLEVQNDLAEMSYITPFGANFLFIGILAPVFEELFYRKAIIDRLRRYGDLPAILISGLIFGLVHGNFSQVFYSTAIGWVLGYVYLKTGNVLYTMSLHSIFNIISGVYVTELIRRFGSGGIPAEGDTIGMVMVLAYNIFTILAFFVGAIFLLASIKRFWRSLQKGEYTLTFDQWMKAIILNPGVWAFLLWMALVFVSSLL